jgi:hypothetical protein
MKYIFLSLFLIIACAPVGYFEQKKTNEHVEKCEAENQILKDEVKHWMSANPCVCYYDDYEE